MTKLRLVQCETKGVFSSWAFKATVDFFLLAF